MGYYSKEKLVEGYRGWLKLQNYHWQSVQYGPIKVVNFLEWMEREGVTEIKDITTKKINNYFADLSKRRHYRTGQPISLATVRSHLTTIKRFNRYLITAQIGQIDVAVRLTAPGAKQSIVLNQATISKLYDTCTDDLLGIRDRAMLALLYGCGLRRNEAIQLEVKDIGIDRNVVHVRYGKGYRMRYVPMIGQVRKDIINYLTIARPMLLERQVHQQLLVGITGKPLSRSGIYERVKKLMRKAKIDKRAGVHTLRHSIATHLLGRGMSLKQIARFLGHSSLESTQIYTRINGES